MILVTGGAGLLGKELITQLLKAGEQVRAVYNNSALPNFFSENLHAVKCDILDVAALEDAMTGITKVYHCAGLVSFAAKDRAKLFQVNVTGTANVANAALGAGVKKFLHVSSVAALGRIRPGELVNETMQWTKETSNSVYGETKYLGELEVWRAAGEGLPMVIVNPVVILGAGDWNEGSSKIFKSVYDELPWYTDGITGFVDVRDCAAAMILLMNSEVENEKFILSAENKSYREVFNLIAKSFNKKAPHKKVTPLIASLVWRLQRVKSFFSGGKPLITKETAATALAQVYFDNTKLLKLFPSFRYRSMEHTIEDTCKLLQQKLNKG